MTRDILAENYGHRYLKSSIKARDIVQRMVCFQVHIVEKFFAIEFDLQIARFHSINPASRREARRRRRVTKNDWIRTKKTDFYLRGKRRSTWVRLLEGLSASVSVLSMPEWLISGWYGNVGPWKIDYQLALASVELVYIIVAICMSSPCRLHRVSN